MAKCVLLTSLVSAEINASPGDVIEGLPADLAKKYTNSGTIRKFARGDEGRRVKQWPNSKQPRNEPAVETEPTETETQDASEATDDAS